MFMVTLRALIVFCLIAASARAAGAKVWPSPAAGMSTSGEIEILFTFDDGPNLTYTPKVLDILKEHHIKAVFFLVGNQIVNNPKAKLIVQRILNEGHVIANHTQNHADLCRVKPERAIYEIDRGKQTIEAAAGIEVIWFRAPYGVRCDRLEAMLAERKIEHFHWDLDPQEWRHGNIAKTVQYVTGQLSREGGRAVLLLHDIKWVTVKALPEILKWIDDENAKRTKSHKRKIHILPAPMLAIERLPPKLVAWFGEATSGIRELPKAIASVLP